MKKRIITIFSAGALALLSACPAFAGFWRRGDAPNENRWVYDNGDGTLAANEWKWIDANADGIAECYCFDAGGWLYVNTETPDHYQVDANGAWIVNGVVQTQTAAQSPSRDTNTAAAGWKQEAGGWRYYKGGHYLTSQWRKISNKRYYFNADGLMVTGFQEIDGNKYYFDSEGALKTKNFTKDDVRYIVEEDGVITDEQDGGDWDTFQSDDYKGNSDRDESSSGKSSPGKSSSGGNADEGSSSESRDPDDYAGTVWAIVNEERQKAGRGELDWSDTLSEAASERAKELTELFSHSRPDGRDCFTVLSEYSIGSMAAGENIAMGQRTPQEVMNAWMNSKGHRENILNASFDTIGVGCYEENGVYYWVQLFIGS
ncbi:hypothetical protein D3Z50_00045 [Clostridiaceae bacterium]|nr:hypothetical protein [Clostridium sp.]NBI69481.1 hypothetical protein [Clostridiaceae bacterium]